MSPKPIARFLPHAVRRILARWRDRFFDVYGVKSYAQEGEDLVLRRILGEQQRGFYVDVGAHHPRRFSNTYHFYRQGWSGINIEPNPDAMRLFARERKRDKNLQIAVAASSTSLDYHEFDDAALNTFDADLANWRVANTPYKLLRRTLVAVQPLAGILNAHLPPGQPIDFLSIDVEGLDFAVLKSNDWEKFRARCVLVEALDASLENAMGSELVRFMQSNGYELFGKMFNTLVFKDARAARGGA